MALVFFLALVLSADLVGGGVLRWLGVEGWLAERRGWFFLRLVSVGLGAGVMGLGALGLAAAGLIAGWVLAGGVGIMAVGRLALALGACSAAGRRSRLSGSDLGGAVLLLPPVLLVLWVAWTPGLLIDSFAYHVTMPRQWLVQGRLLVTPYELHSNLHFLSESVVCWCLALAPDDMVLAKLPSVGAAAGVAVLLAIEGRRRFGSWAGGAAGWLWLMSDQLLEAGTDAYADAPAAFFLLAGVLALGLAVEAPGRVRVRMFAVAGLLLGFAAGTKHTGLLFAGMAGLAGGVVFAVRVRRLGGGRALRGWGVGAGALSLAAGGAVAPWLAKNWIVTGNPFYPFLLGTFGAGPEYLAVARDFHASYGNYDSVSGAGAAEWGRRLNHFLVNVWHVSQHQLAAAGLVGMLWALRRLPREAGSRALLLAGLAMWPLVAFAPAWRFAFAPLAVVLAAGLAGWRVRGAAGIALLAAACAACVPHAVESARAQRDRGEVPLGDSLYLTAGAMRRDYFERHPEWAFFQAVERAVGPDGKVLATDNCTLHALLDVALLPNPNMHGRRMHSILAEDGGLDAEGIAARWRQYGVTHVLSSEAFDRSEAERELRARWLEPVVQHGGKSLYRLRDVRDGLTGHGS